ncbi:hypothetical protein V7S43_000060 [Phytophthora oleae]|uniref:Uncharacterized protein n=1 Tax=Phytophthora oleae TaxID=2107226 RepID=A0ABD3G688_9STRA
MSIEKRAAEAPSTTEMLTSVGPLQQETPVVESTSKLTLHDGGHAAKGVLRRRLSSSKSAVSSTDMQWYLLTIIGVKGLAGRLKQSPYCICRFETSGREFLHQVQTSA